MIALAVGQAAFGTAPARGYLNSRRQRLLVNPFSVKFPVWQLLSRLSEIVAQTHLLSVAKKAFGIGLSKGF